MAESTASTSSGVAGRTNYAEWDKKTRDLLEKTEADDAEEVAEAQEALGHKKHAVSQAHADEMAKAKNVAETKKKLQQYEEKQLSLAQTLKSLLDPVPAKEEDDKSGEKATSPGVPVEPSPSSSSPRVVRITRDRMDAGKRVLNIFDTSGSPVVVDDDSSSTKNGNAKLDMIVLTQDLSQLESKMAANAMQPVKSYPDDAENSVKEEEKEQQRERSIFGIIKLFIANVHNCQIIIKCKVITGSVELHNCTNVHVVVEKTATVATVQADLSKNLTIEFHDAPSGKHSLMNPKPLYWGDDKDDRIYHAGVENMCLRLIRDDHVEQEHKADYLRDGAVAVGNSTASEYQFITSVVDGNVITEAVVTSKGSGGSRAGVRAMTKRELQEEERKREAAGKRAVDMAEDMIQIKDKDGNVMATKAASKAQADEIVEEVYTSMTKADVDAIVAACQENKANGNTAFGTGEYGQAILLYTLALDKSDELPDNDDKTKQFPRDVVFSNRAACFLKLGQHEKAVKDATQAASTNPENIKAWFRWGLALHAMGKYSEALPHLAKAHKMEPKNKQIKQALQFCEVRLEQEYRKRMQG